MDSITWNGGQQAFRQITSTDLPGQSFHSSVVKNNLSSLAVPQAGCFRVEGVDQSQTMEPHLRSSSGLDFGRAGLTERSSFSHLLPGPQHHESSVSTFADSFWQGYKGLDNVAEMMQMNSVSAPIIYARRTPNRFSGDMGIGAQNKTRPSPLVEALGNLESIKETLQSHKPLLAIVSHLEEAIIRQMMTDTRKTREKAGLRPWGVGSAYQSMSQASATSETEETESLAAFDFNLDSSSSSSAVPEDRYHGTDESDQMDVTMESDMEETPRPIQQATAATALYHCIFQKPGDTCEYSTPRKGDWVRHGESEEHFPQKRHMCISCIKPLQDEDGNTICLFCSTPISTRGNNKQHYLQCKGAQKGRHIFAGAREDHFKHHLRTKHGLAGIGDEESTWTFAVSGYWPRECGFCGDRFSSWQVRTNHIADHFRDGADISTWKLPFGKAKAPPDYRPGFEYQERQDDDDDDDFNPFGGGGSSRIPGHLFDSSGSGSSSSQTSSSHNDSQDWFSFVEENMFEMLEMTSATCDSKLRVEKCLENQSSTDQDSEENTTSFEDNEICSSAEIELLETPTRHMPTRDVRKLVLEEYVQSENPTESRQEQFSGQDSLACSFEIASARVRKSTANQILYGSRSLYGPPPPPPSLPMPIRQQTKRTSPSDVNCPKNLDNSECVKLLTEYKVFTIRKVTPQSPKEKATWFKAETTEEQLEQSEILKQIKKLDKSHKNVLDKKADLAPAQQSQIHNLLDDLMSSKENGYFKWSLVQLDSQKRDVASKESQKYRADKFSTQCKQRLYEAVTMTVYVKREDPDESRETKEAEASLQPGTASTVERVPDDDAEMKAIIEAGKRLTITHEDVVIAVMGLTGSGKSTFINHLAGHTALGRAVAGDTLKSCTANVGIHPFAYKDGQTIYLIDTPGFDDTQMSDIEVLHKVAIFLSSTYSMDIKLAGIIYLHKIIDERMGHTACDNLSMFQKICGSTCLSNVVLATTMWDRLTDVELGNRREAELIREPDFWGEMIKEGSTVLRQDDGPRSALKIMDYIMGLKKGAVVTQIAKQMVDEHMLLKDTSAGQDARKMLIALEKRNEEKIQRMRESTEAMIKAGNQRAAEKYARKEAELIEERKRHSQDQRRLTEDFMEQQRKNDEENKLRIANIQAQMRADTEAHRKAIEEKEQEVQRVADAQKFKSCKEGADAEARANWERHNAELQFQKDRHLRELRDMKDAMDAQSKKGSGMGGNSHAFGGLAVAVAGAATLNPVLVLAGLTTMTVGGAYDAMKRK